MMELTHQHEVESEDAITTDSLRFIGTPEEYEELLTRVDTMALTALHREVEKLTREAT